MANINANTTNPPIIISDNSNTNSISDPDNFRYSSTLQSTNVKTPQIMSMSSSSSLVPSERNPRQEATSKTTKTITTTTVTTNQTKSFNKLQQQKPSPSPTESNMAVVEDLGRQANISRSSMNTSSSQINNNINYKQPQVLKTINDNTIDSSDKSTSITIEQRLDDNKSNSVEGNKLVTTISTIVAQSGHSRIVLTLLKDGKELQLNIQDMKPGIFEVGLNYKDCIRYYEEQQKLMKNLRKLKKTPIDEWVNKFNYIQKYKEVNMNNKRKLVYMCMLENLQTSWRSLLKQLEKRTNLLEESCKFYESCEQLLLSLDRADNHIQVFRQEFLNGPTTNQQNNNNNLKFNQAFNELKSMNETILEQYNYARLKQKELIQIISLIGTQNLNDSRVNLLVNDAQQLINYISTYLEPLERRKIQLENVIKTTTTTTTTTTNMMELTTNKNNIIRNYNNNQQFSAPSQNGITSGKAKTSLSSTTTTTSFIREISNFNDLNLVENWLNLKIDQLNSSLLSSLGVSVSDSRSILNKHEQIALECAAIEEATKNFNGKNIHAIKQLDSKDDKLMGDKSLFEQQKLLAIKSRDVITILDARIVLLKRTIDFYLRSKDSTMDIGKMMLRLQVDNSLQSVQYVSNELEFKDVSSVVASGATILSELQQLQLAQQHGQRSRIINLNLVTIGIRSIIDQLNQDLAHLKTVLNQRKLILLNEDTTKMLSNFTQKCQQLHLWLNNQAKTFLINNNRIIVVESLPYTIQQVRLFCDSHDQLRVGLQNKTLEVEALLRSLPTLIENFDSKSKTSNEVQQITDELRQDWIMVTNCFDKRSEFAKKYLSILHLIDSLDKELVTLKQFNVSGRPITPSDERTDEEIRSNIDQIFIQLTNQVKNFNIDSQKSSNSTELIYNDDFNSHGKKRQVNDINRQQVVDYVNNLLINYAQKYKIASTVSQLSNKMDANNNSGKREETTIVNHDDFADDDEVDLINKDNRSSSANTINSNKKPTKTSKTSITATSTTTTTTTTKTTKPKEPAKPPASQRPQQIDPPRFTRILQDKMVEPFSQVELECETDEQTATSSNDFKIEWFMNNFKRIPPSIKHSTVSEKNHHKLIIYNFSPICCGIYQVRASNSAGQVVSQCRLKLSGIKEIVDAPVNNNQNLEKEVEVGTFSTYNSNRATNNFQTRQSNNNSNPFSPSPATSGVNSTSSFSQWQSAPANTGPTNNNLDRSSISRIIQGVESPVSGGGGDRIGWQNQSTVKITQVSTSSCDSSSFNNQEQSGPNKPELSSSHPLDKFPITQTTYSGPKQQQQQLQPAIVDNQNQLRVSYIDSPTLSSTTLSRSVSKSPFEGTPQPPVFMHGLTDTMPHCHSRAGLVCLVMGNPPPTIEWLHNNQTIATTKCPKGTGSDGAPRGSICKLTIETMNPKTQGQYVCKASNRIGQTSTGITLSK